jgi:hypothetical protein
VETDHGEPDVAAGDAGQRAEKLRIYVRANAGRFTDAALSAELQRSGYSTDEINAALADAVRDAPAPQGRRAIATILIAYAVTFAVLSLGMLGNASLGSSGCCMPGAAGGIVILGISLAVALLLSLAWVGNRRAAALLFAGLIILYGVGTLGAGTAGVIAIAIGVALAVLVLRRGPPTTGRATATLGTLLSVPVILLVIVAGLCVITGMPIPRAG